ncbi:MAG: hypothetical protein NC324_03070 [Bacteroides sp.]|nr:hypothetical protein [Bacteroides sp.]
MSVVNYGLSKFEYTKSVNGAPAADAVWKEMPEIKQNTAAMNTEQGEKTEYIDERGNIIDTRVLKSKFTLEIQLFMKKGDDYPIPHEDGIITDNYAIRLSPEDPSNNGILIENCSVSVEETWNTADGGLLKYTFTGLKPKTGNIVKRYIAKPEGAGMENE